MTFADRLLSKSLPIPFCGCWIWMGTTNKDGYGVFAVSRSRNALAHRVSYMTFVGPIPDGALVCHSCDLPPCVNPDHLFTGTDADNTSDKVKKGRQATRRTGLGKLTVEQVAFVLSDGRNGKTLAQELGVSKGAVCLIRRQNGYQRNTKDRPQ